MKKTTSGDLSHVTSGPGDRRVSTSRNPVAMTDLQRRLLAGKAGLLELALLRESHRRLVDEAKGRLEEQTKRAAMTEEQRGSRRSQRSVSESFNGATEVYSSSSSDEDEDEEDGAGSSVDDVFYNNSFLNSQRPIKSSNTSSFNRLLATVSSSNNRLLATDPNRPTCNSSSNTKHRRRMSEMQCRGSAGKSSFHRTFNGIRLSAHRRRSEGTFLGVLLHRRPGRPIRDDCLSDSFRKPVTISGLTFNFPSPQHAVMAQFGIAGREVRTSVGPASRCPYPSEGDSEGSSGFDVRKDRGVGFHGGELVGREGWITGESENTLLLPWRVRERSAVSESSIFHPQRSRVRLGDIASVHPDGQNLFSKSIEQDEDLGETSAAVSSAPSNVEERSSEDDHPEREDPELERGSSEEKDAEDQSEVLDLPKESVSRPRLSRTTLYQLSEEGYFSGSDCQPTSGPEQSTRRRGRTGSRSSPKRSNSKESSRTSSTANSTETELKQETTSGSGLSTVIQSETKIETSSKQLMIFC